MKTVRHNEPDSSEKFDNYFYGYRYLFTHDDFFYYYCQGSPPTKDELFNEKQLVSGKILVMYDFYKEIKIMEHNFKKDGDHHLFFDLSEKLDKILQE